MELVELVDVAIYLIDCDEALVVLIDDSEDRLVLLLINGEFLLHFLGVGIGQQTLLGFLGLLGWLLFKHGINIVASGVSSSHVCDLYA